MKVHVEHSVDLSPGEETALRRKVQAQSTQDRGRVAEPSDEESAAWLREHLPMILRDYLDRSYFTISFSAEDLLEKARNVEKAYKVAVVEQLQEHHSEFMRAFDEMLVPWVEDLVETLMAEMFVHYRHESNVRFFPSLLFLGRHGEAAQARR